MAASEHEFDPAVEDAGAPRGRSAFMRLEVILERSSPGFVILVGLLLLALVGLVDALTNRFDVTVFYLVPVALVTFARGRWMGLLMAGVAAIAWEAAEVVNHVTTVQSAVTYWNALTRFYAYAAVVLLVWPMRAALLYERGAAEKQAEAADQLRALMELRDAAEHTSWEPMPSTDPAMDGLREALDALDETQKSSSAGA